MNQPIDVVAWSLMVPMMLIMFYMVWQHRGEPWHEMNLMWSIMLILLAAVMVRFFTVSLVLIDEWHDKQKITDGMFKEIKSSGLIWVAILPMVAGGVGIGILTNFLSARKPSSEPTNKSA